MIDIGRCLGLPIALATLLLAPVASAAVSAQQIAAAEATAAGASCKAASSFYWEVGDKSGVGASGVQGLLAKKGSTAVSIDSGSKLLFAAYVVQYRRGAENLSPAEIAYLRMQQGYTKNQCVGGGDVLGCFKEFSNNVQSSTNVGKFYYSGGQLQALAAIGLDQVLSNATDAALADTVSSTLGLPANTLSFSTPTVAGGAIIAPSAYGAWLRQILSGSLSISRALGLDAICTSTASNAAGVPACPAAAYAPPIPGGQVWQYSFGHWVEKDPDSAAGDGAFSSPGESGFYPWIDSTRSYYGIVSRSGTVSRTAYESAVLCGQAIRKAFISGVGQ